MMSPRTTSLSSAVEPAADAVPLQRTPPPLLAVGSERIADYRVIGELGRGQDSIVLRVEKGGRPYALKKLRSEAARDADASARFRREGSCLARLTHPCLPMIVEVGGDDAQPYLVMELVEGQTLEQRLREGPLSRQEIIALAIELASALVEVHRHGMVHRDLKPANVMLTPSGAVKLVDFGYADRAVEPSDHDDVAIGTFMYAAPEQTRIVKRPVDGRSDLYALGATLFECATGRPPFQADGVSELLRQHAALVPPRIDAVVAGASAVLAAIIAKLLEKDSDDRYASASGLLADLQRVPELEAALAAGGQIALDARGGATHRQRLAHVGRARELHSLRRALGDVREKGLRVVHLEGPTGIGKSRLAHELADEARGSGSLVLESKCQAADARSFAPLRDAIDGHVAMIMRLPEAERAPHVQRLRDAAGEVAPILNRLSRGLATVVGSPTSVEPLDASSERERFYRTLHGFLVRLGAASGTLVWIIDDVQWLDGATRELLERLASGGDESTPMLVLTTRRADDDAANTGPTRTDFGPDAERHELGALTPGEVASLVADYLGRPLADATLPTRLAALADGNPLVVVEHLESMLQSGVLTPKREGWDVDWAAFEQMDLSRNVERLLLARLDASRGVVRDVLEIAAIVGSRFSSDVLVAASGRSEEEVVVALEQGAAANLIEQTRDGNYRFVHDRLQGALEESMSDARRRDLHDALAVLVDVGVGVGVGVDQDSESVYALARHLANGHPERRPRRLFEVMLAAGKHALDEFANAAAVGFLQYAGDAARAADLDREERMMLAESVGLALARVGRMEEAYAELRHGLALARTGNERASFHHLLALNLASEGRNREAWDQVVVGYAEAGHAVSRFALVQVIVTLYSFAAAWLRVATGFGYGSARGESAQRRRILSRLNDVASIVTYMSGQPYALLGVIVRQLHNAHFLGTSRENAKAHAWFGFALALFALARGSRKHSEKAIRMAQHVGDRGLLAYVRYLEAIQTSVAGDLIRGEELSKNAIVEGRKWLGSYEYAQVTTELAYEYLYRGLSHDAIAMAQAELPAIDRANSALFQANMRGALYSQLALVGRMDEAVRVREEWLVRAAHLPDVAFCQTYVHANEIQVLLDQEDFGPALELHIEKFLGWAADEYHNRYAYGLIAYVRREQFQRATGSARPAARREFVRSIRAFAIMRAATPVHQCHVAVLRAALAREDGRLGRAARLLRKAETLAAFVDSRWAAFEIERERARIARRRRHADSESHVTRALDIARAQGWRNRSRQVEREFGVALATEVPRMQASTHTRRVSHGERFADALVRVGLASGSVLDPDAQARAVLDEIVALFASERAFLFRCDDAGELILQAGRDAKCSDVTELTGHSQTVVRRVHDERRPLIVTGTEEGEALGAQSVVAFNLRSIMAAPIVLQDRMLGVVYVDSRVAKGLFAEEDLDVFVALANQIGVVLKMAEGTRLEVQRAAMEKELQLTAAVQSMFLPKHAHHRAAKFEVCGVYRPAAMSGGDWWWYDAPSEHRLRVVIGDLTGHGAAPAMLTAAVATCFRHVGDGPNELRRTLEDVHRLLHDVTESAYAMTLCAIDLDAKTGEVECLFAGSPPLFRLVGGEKAELVPSGGAPLGVTGLMLEHKKLQLGAGDRLVLFTDGLNEMPVSRSRQLGLRRLQRLLADDRNESARAAADALVAGLDAVRREAGVEADDDMTVVMVDVGPRP